MAYTLDQMAVLFPELQLAGGVGIVHVGGKNIEIGKLVANEEFILNGAGQDLVQLATPAPATSDKPRMGRKSKGEAEPSA